MFDLVFFTCQDFRYFEIDADNKLSPRESSLALFYRRDARTFPHEIEKHLAGAAGVALPARILQRHDSHSISSRRF